MTKKLWIAAQNTTDMCRLFCPLLIKNWESRFAQLFFKSLDKRTKKAPAIVYVAGAVKVSFVNLD